MGTLDILCDPDEHFMAQFPMAGGEKVSRAASPPKIS